ncbi:MAG: FAD binding domain-containing protein [Pseudomonadales bacterium]
MAALTYHAPNSIDDAIKILADASLPPKVLSGGTDLIIQMQRPKAPEALVVDVKKIPGMRDAEWSEDGLTLGPAMSCAEFTKRQDIKSIFPGLVEAAYLIGSTQVQGRASLGGNLCNASPAADTIPALIANRAICVIQGPSGTRVVPVEAFVTGVGKNCLEQGELLAALTLARPEPGTADAYLRFIPRTEMDIAVAGAAVSLTLDSRGVCRNARIAIGAVAPTAILVPVAEDILVGETISDEVLAGVAQAASDAASPISDRRGTVEFRRHVVGVLTKRATLIAAERAGAQL